MRFRRIILRSLALRSLAPLLGLSALMTAMATGGDASGCPPPDTGTLARLLRSVVHFVTPTAEHAAVNPSANRPSPQAFLGLSALAATPLAHSLWMVTRPATAMRYQRRPQLQPLRC
jgi:hypothetical protein